MSTATNDDDKILIKLYKTHPNRYEFVCIQDENTCQNEDAYCNNETGIFHKRPNG